MLKFIKESVIAAPPERVFAFHERPDALALLQPAWEQVEVVRPPASLEVGTRVILRTRVGPLWTTIEAEHVAYDPPHSFEDVMQRGPFRYWHHRHLCLPHDEGCLLRDEIRYLPPLGMLGRLVDPWLVRPRLQRLFDHRHEVTRREVLAASEWK